MIDIKNVVETEEEGKLYQLTEDEYTSLTTALQTYKTKYEEAAKQLEDEKDNVANLLMKVEELKDQVTNLEKHL